MPLLRDTEIIERPADQTTITRRYTEAAVDFIRTHQEGPFFVYLPHSMVHVPLFRSEAFVDRSARGLYGDCVEEVDWSVGQVLQTLRDEGLSDRTLVVFSSDNGPWLTFFEQGGSAGLLKDGKGSTWEGGMREPTVAWWPGKIPAGVVSQELACTMDLFTTCVKLGGAELPSDRIIDGVDLRPVLFGDGSSPRESFFYYRGTHLMAVRVGPWKAHFFTQPAYGEGADKRTPHDPPLLYHLEHDPGEQYNLVEAHPDVLDRIAEVVVAHQRDLVIAPSQLEIPLPAGK